MGGTAPYCPFCGQHHIGLKDHIKAKHSDKYPEWIKDGQPPYWRYDKEGKLILLQSS